MCFGTRPKNVIQNHSITTQKATAKLLYPCLFCILVFTTPTEVVQHLLLGACPRAPVQNRSTILRIFRCFDPNTLIANQMIESSSQTTERSLFGRLILYRQPLTWHTLFFVACCSYGNEKLLFLPLGAFVAHSFFLEIHQGCFWNTCTS